MTAAIARGPPRMTTTLPHRPLAGRYLALIGSPERGDAQAFIDAAAALGAQVACVDARPLLDAPAQRLPELARMIGQLYQGVDCCGLAPALVAQLDAHAGIPVTNGLADHTHPLRQRAGLSALLVASFA